MIWALLTAIVVFVGPFLVAKLIARLLRLKDISVRLGIVLLAATLGITPFAAQWVLGMQEQREHDAALAEWQEKLEQRQSNSKITDAGLDKLRQGLPDVQILRGGEGEAGDEGQFTAPPADAAPAGGATPGAPGAGARSNPASAADGSANRTPANGGTPAAGRPAADPATNDTAPAGGSN